MRRILPEPRYFSIHSTVGRRRDLEKGSPELHAVDAVVNPGAACLHELAGRNHRGVTKQSNQVTLAARFDAQHAKAVLVIVERHPLDQAGQDFLGRAWRRSLEHGHPRNVRKYAAWTSAMCCRRPLRGRFDKFWTSSFGC